MRGVTLGVHAGVSTGRMNRRILGFAGTACALACACTSESPLQASNAFCTRELRVQFSPSDTNIRVAHGFRASVRLSGCGGAQVLNDVVRWQSEDPSVATVDPISGDVVGRTPGVTRIAATGQAYGAVGSLRVEVGGS